MFNKIKVYVIVIKKVIKQAVIASVFCTAAFCTWHSQTKVIKLAVNT